MQATKKQAKQYTEVFTKDSAGIDSLTPREREVLGMIGQGLSLIDIAKQLHRSYATIKTHRRMLGLKLRVSNHVELARIAIQTGLTSLDKYVACGPDLMTHAQDTLGMLESKLAPMIGNSFFHTLTQELVGAFNVKCVLLGRLVNVESSLIQTLSVCIDGNLVDNFEFDFRGTPCELAIQNRLYFCQSALRQQFKIAPPIIALTLAPESYCGAAILSNSNRPIGILAVLHDTPLEFDFEMQALLRIFAARAAAEFETLYKNTTCACKKRAANPVN